MSCLFFYFLSSFNLILDNDFVLYICSRPFNLVAYGFSNIKFKIEMKT